jgi:hypothetical protein
MCSRSDDFLLDVVIFLMSFCVFFSFLFDDAAFVCVSRLILLVHLGDKHLRSRQIYRET